MPAFIALLRSINVGGRNLISMEALRGVFHGLGYASAKTLLQSGNVVFPASGVRTETLAAQLETAIETAAGFRPVVVVLARPELDRVVRANPFAGRTFEPSRLLVLFPAAAPVAGAEAALRAAHDGPEEFHLAAGALYVHYVDGVARSKLTTARIEKALGVPVTGRNWNTALKLQTLAAELG